MNSPLLHPPAWHSAGPSAGNSGAGAGGAAAGAAAGGDLKRYNVPHLPFLTPPHLRKGKGGRQPAADPRMVSAAGSSMLAAGLGCW